MFGRGVSFGMALQNGLVQRPDEADVTNPNANRCAVRPTAGLSAWLIVQHDRRMAFRTFTRTGHAPPPHLGLNQFDLRPSTPPPHSQHHARLQPLFQNVDIPKAWQAYRLCRRVGKSATAILNRTEKIALVRCEH